MRKVFYIAIALFVCTFSHAAVTIKSAQGWLESAFVEWAPLSGYTNYHVYVRPAGGTYQPLDKPLLRSYGSYYRADALGLTAGNYQLKVVPVQNGNEVAAQATETASLAVSSHDRHGFAHTGAYSVSGGQGIGAYNNDGTLKTGAKVFYVHAGNAKTISTNVVTNSNGAVTVCTGMQAIITAYQKGYDTTPLCFRLLGTIEANQMDALDSSEEGLQIKGKAADSELNITIEGVGKDALIRGFGILVRNAKSVELRNFAIMTAMDDCISLDTDNSNIWVHHIDGFYGTQGSGDHAKGDGTIDVKTNSKRVTVSYNHFWDTGKSTMCGMKSETSPNYITYHHNWFDHSDSRHPRIRTMSVHIYNNYYDGVSKYGVGVTSGSSAFVENNYFRNCPKPMLISLQGTDTHNGAAEADGTFSSEEGGIIKAYNNTFSGSKTLVYYNASTAPVHFDAYQAQTRSEQVPASVTTKSGNHTYDNFDTNAQIMYSVTPDAPADVPTIVQGSLGAGRMQHGDVNYSFTAADDSSYDLNAGLVALIASYSSSLDSIFGEAMFHPEAPDTTQQGGAGDYECFFEGGQPSSSFYTITGSFSNSKGSVEVNGTTYSWCLKMEGSTNVAFTTTDTLTLYLVFDSPTANIKIDGTKVTAANGIIQRRLAPGAHSLTKADSNNLYYINLLGGSSQQTAIHPTADCGLRFDGQFLHNPQCLSVRLYTLSGTCLGSTTSSLIGTENLPAGQYIAATSRGVIRFVK